MSSSINRLLSRRRNTTRDQEKKVMSPPAASTSSTSGSFTSPSFRSSSGSVPFSLSSGHSSSTSYSSLSLAFSAQRPKRSPHLQATDVTIHASTANTYDRLLLQPKQTSGRLFGVFPEDKNKHSGSDDESKVCLRVLRILFTPCSWNAVDQGTVSATEPCRHHQH